MPMTGTDHDLMIEKLKVRGICTEAEATGAHEVADRIWAELSSLLTGWIHQPFRPRTSAALQEVDIIPGELSSRLTDWKNANLSGLQMESGHYWTLLLCNNHPRTHQ
jgi:hypothetical protein